jgi:hypothetical protein
MRIADLLRGVFRSVPELVDAIEDYIALHNENPKPFIWTAKATDILRKVIRAIQRLSSKQNEALHWLRCHARSPILCTAPRGWAKNAPRRAEKHLLIRQLIGSMYAIKRCVIKSL